MTRLTTSTTWEVEAGGVRVLVEAENWPARQHLARVLQDAGYQVEACPGPSGADARCPLTTGDGCQAAGEAEVVVFALHPGDERNRECLRAHRRLHPETPVVVDLPEPALAHDPGDWAGCVLVQDPGSSESLLTAVEQALT